jgi:hypothetical protein
VGLHGVAISLSLSHANAQSANFSKDMGRYPGLSRRTHAPESTPIPPRRNSPRKGRLTNSPLSNPAFEVNCVTSQDDSYQVFHLSNGATYTLFPTQSTPEHHWGAIHVAEWRLSGSPTSYPCVIKASEFLLRRRNKSAKSEYRRPRNDFDREIKAFQLTRHKNVLRMYDFWEWRGRGYLSMKQMKGSLGDMVYDPTYTDILAGLRLCEGAMAELVRQVISLLL